jgi:hypothetical protein
MDNRRECVVAKVTTVLTNSSGPEIGISNPLFAAWFAAVWHEFTTKSPTDKEPANG